jgi:hypothetical protein
MVSQPIRDGDVENLKVCGHSGGRDGDAVHTARPDGQRGSAAGTRVPHGTDSTGVPVSSVWQTYLVYMD